MLAADGPFSGVLTDYQPRAGQQSMAALIENVIDNREPIVIEAPPGAGKTFAYLVAVLIKGKKAVISTATHYLQHQLSCVDIPLVQKALGSRCKVAVLKGRSNYLCPYYLEKAISGEITVNKRTHQLLMALWQRFRDTATEYWADVLPTPDVQVLRYATCNTEACLGKSCPQIARCPLMRARERASSADIVVVNHSLLFSDQVMRRDQLPELLPNVDVVIVDEAHRLAEFGQKLVGDALSSAELKRYNRDAIAAVTEFAPEQIPVRDFLLRFDRAVSRLSDNLPTTTPYFPKQHIAIVEQLLAAVVKLADWLKGAADRAWALRELEIRTQSLVATLRNITVVDGLCWVEPTTHGFILRNVPVDFAALTQSLFKQTNASWVFTSATLSVAGSADKFLRHVGLADTHFHHVASTIDYTRNAALYNPPLSNEPGHDNYVIELAEHVSALLQLVKGRVLFLFTSHNMLQKMARLLAGICRQTLLVQGMVSNDQLIERFKGTDEAVLLGTGSFWEGLDLSGARLAAVIIDKLPFASPSDPLVQLRSYDLAANGVDSFEYYLLPDAVIRLRQGCGRLLRRLSDKGIIMVADPRLHSKPYGAVFIDSLPTMMVSRSLAPLDEFLRY